MSGAVVGHSAHAFPRKVGSLAASEVYDTERHLLYVARTRARDHLLVTGVDPASEFLEDLTSDRTLVTPRDEWPR